MTALGFFLAQILRGSARGRRPLAPVGCFSARNQRVLP